MAAGVGQAVLEAVGAQAGDRAQVLAQGVGPHQLAQPARDLRRVAQRELDLLASVGGHRELDVPAGVRAAGAAAQRDAGARQAEAAGVVVGRVQHAFFGRFLGLDARDPGQAGNRRGRADLVLALPFDDRRRHTLRVAIKPAAKRFRRTPAG